VNDNEIQEYYDLIADAYGRPDSVSLVKSILKDMGKKQVEKLLEKIKKEG